MAKIGKAARKSVLVIHGPNLNLLGVREPGVYGRESLAAIDKRLAEAGRAAGAQIRCFQSNLEGDLIDRVQQAKGERVDFIVLNLAREAFRRRSYFSDLAVGTICGLGSRGYDFALEYALAARSTAGGHPGR
jgi:3-dehydroquinate dehydratase-2